MTPTSRLEEPAEKPNTPASKPGTSRGVQAKQARAVSPPAPAAGPRKGSTPWAAIEVLRDKRKPLHAIRTAARSGGTAATNATTLDIGLRLVTAELS